MSLAAAIKASAALEMFRSLSSSNSSSANATGSRRDSDASDMFGDIFGGTAMSGKSTSAFGLDGFAQISTATINALLAAQNQPSTAAPRSAGTGKPDVPKDLFSQLDANGDGQVTRSEFETNAAGAATSSYNSMEQMIARQMQAFASSSSAWMRL